MPSRTPSSARSGPTRRRCEPARSPRSAFWRLQTPRPSIDAHSEDSTTA
jgi:hypothetical protein